MIKVSVIMPVYNVEEYLEEALLSVVNQTLQEIEIICVNDGSTDSSLNILERYAKMDERIRIISKENSGYGHSLNVGIDVAQGEYIGIVETDDYIEDIMYETLYEKAVRDNLDLVKAGCAKFVLGQYGVRQYEEVKVLPADCEDLYDVVTCYAMDSRVFKGYVYTWSGIYKRSFLNTYNIRHNETSGASYQDNGFWFQTMMYAERISFLKNSCYNLRRDNPNSSIRSKQKIYCISDEYDFIRDKILNSSLENKKVLLQIAFYHRFMNYHYHYNRVADELKVLMMERIRKDINYALENGEIAVNMYTKEEWQQLFIIMNEEKMIAPNHVFIPDRVKKKIDEATSLYIYGAGIWAGNVYNKLNTYPGTGEIKAFLVTNIEEQQEVLYNVPVIELDKAELMEDDLVIVAVADKYLAQVLTILEHKGHGNFILKNELF